MYNIIGQVQGRSIKFIEHIFSVEIKKSNNNLWCFCLLLFFIYGNKKCTKLSKNQNNDEIK